MATQDLVFGSYMHGQVSPTKVVIRFVVIQCS